MAELNGQIVLAYAELDLFCIFIIISTLTVAARVRKRVGQHVSLLTVTGTVFFIFHVLADLFLVVGNHNPVPEELLYFIGSCFYMTVAAAAAVWMVRVCHAMKYSFLSRPVPTALMLIPAALIVLLSLTDRWHGLIFSVSTENTVIRGPFHAFATFGTFAYFVLTGILAGCRRKKPELLPHARILVIFALLTVGFAAADDLLDLHLVPVGFTVGLVVCYAHTVMETAEEQRRELTEKEQLATAGNRAKTEFLFNMSHDIRTPMNAVIGYTAMARKNLDCPEQAGEYLDKADRAGQNLLQLIDQVLEMSRLETGKSEPEEKQAVITEWADDMLTVVREEAQKHGIRLKSDIGTIPDDQVLTDISRMNMVMTNILSNAVRYTPDGGTVTLTVRQLGSSRPGYHDYLFVTEDTGIGMSEEFRKKIFDVFTREQSSTVSGIPGSGLGMAIVKKQVELLNGTVEVESEPGKGTKVSVTVPMKLLPHMQDGDTEPVNRDTDLQGKRALVVEDNEMNREITRDILEDEGMLVETADDGDTAVDMVRRSYPGYYDFVLMDVQMPRMNGYEATRAIRDLGNRQLASILIIATTANALEEDRRDALEAGMNEHLGKPIDISRLMEILKKFLR